jgi:CRISPR/Cas system-associated exonuclease Cas4 (RecB family)
MMRSLSKSKIIAYRQCHRRLWLEVHRPELRDDSEETEGRFAIGHQLGEIARRLYDPKQKGQLIDIKALGMGPALELSGSLLKDRKILFEAGISAGGALAFTDVMVPATRRGKPSWKVIEVKSSTSVKDYHRDDAAVQAYVMKSAGVDYRSILLAHIDNAFVYDPTQGYVGLLAEENVTREADARFDEVKEWVAEAHSIVGKGREPSVRIGRHCTDPFECGFRGYCGKDEPKAAYPASLLPRVQSKKLKSLIETNPALELADVPDDLLNDLQMRVKSHTLSNTVFFDWKGAARALAQHKLPAYFLDFETVQIAIPIWNGMRPYRQVPFQFSVHYLSKKLELSHRDFIDLSGSDPSESFARSVIEAMGEKGPIFVYNAAFETGRIKELAERFPRLRQKLLALSDRVVDLLPIARECYYHPSQEGSWSIKSVLPAIAPDLHYDELEGVRHGGDAMLAYAEAIAPETTDQRRREIERQLREYCKLDTFAMVRIWKAFSGKPESTNNV